MSPSVNERVQKRREALRRSGLRPVQLWGPDTRAEGFAQECLRQSALIALTQDKARLQQALAALASTEAWSV